MAFKALWQRLGLSVDWTPRVLDGGRRARGARASAPSFACSRAARPTRPRRRRSGTSTSARRSPRPSSRTASTPAPTTDSRSRASTPRAPSRSRRPGPSCSPSCVALVAHPDDARYRPLFGASVRTPLFSVRVPVLAHELADPEKGSGIAMVCTFGDTTDVVVVARARPAAAGAHRARRTHAADDVRRAGVRVRRRGRGERGLRASSPARP